MINLNLGCWHRYIPGWVHVDLCDMPHIDHKSAIDSLPMFDDASVDLIYSSHSFEYFDRQSAPRVLAEWHRVLKPGGLLRLAVPDFAALVEIYARTGATERVIGPLYGRMEINTENGPQTLFHKTVYDYASLSQMLVDNGFSDVRRYDWRDTIHKDYDDHSQAYFPHMDKENGILVSLNVEANKV
ncbi:MAG: methyltransferase domain-containing protein [Parasphingorhabdus sp.]|nr:methyltransferase domain-containing protein [Parasphingorhabdus sp.]